LCYFCGLKKLSLKEVTPYNDNQETKKGQVSKMFNRIAPHYDFLNHFLSLGIDRSWRKKAINTLQSHKPLDFVVDIATGTADVAISLAQTLKPGKIIGVDIARQMLDIGDKKITRKNLENRISLELGDSEDLRFDTDSVDAVTVAFGVRNFENVSKGLLEIHRILRPGGKLVVLEFSKPRIFPLKQLYNTYFKYILPFIGRITSKDPKAYSYLYESVQAFPDGKDFLEVLKKTGFIDTTWKSLTLGICSIYTGIK
jgi:demethylmenaquinone methyltransferase / 2-methoxy-6-polyprenyl-1,4-benzoquinol methylase